jgi:hypothetical protein
MASLPFSDTTVCILSAIGLVRWKMIGRDNNIILLQLDEIIFRNRAILRRNE